MGRLTCYTLVLTRLCVTYCYGTILCNYYYSLGHIKELETLLQTILLTNCELSPTLCWPLSHVLSQVTKGRDAFLRWYVGLRGVQHTWTLIDYVACRLLGLIIVKTLFITTHLLWLFTTCLVVQQFTLHLLFTMSLTSLFIKHYYLFMIPLRIYYVKRHIESFSLIWCIGYSTWRPPDSWGCYRLVSEPAL